MELAALKQRRRVESMLTEKTAMGRVAQAVTFALADVRRFFEANRHPELEPSEVTAQVNDRVFRPMLRDLIAVGLATGEFAVPDLDFSVACCMAIGMEAVRVIQEDPSRRPEGAALDAVRRLLSPVADGPKVNGREGR